MTVIRDIMIREQNTTFYFITMQTGALKLQFTNTF